MPKVYPVSTNNQKQEIIAVIKDKSGRVSDLAKEYGI
jgi:hypothetical protein